MTSPDRGGDEPRQSARAERHGASAGGAEERRERLRILLGLEPTTTEGRLAEVPPAPSDGGPVEVQLLAPCGEPGVEPDADPDVIPAFLLRPDPERDTGAGVVLIAGHGRGIDDLVATDPADEYHDALALKLGRAGLTVLCPEMVSFGRRRVPPPPGGAPWAPEEKTCEIDAARHLLRGRPVMGRRVADARAAVQALRALPGVDPERVAVAGGSGGGAVALLLAAVDETVAAALVATYFSSFAASIASIRHCPCNIVPGLLPGLEMADIAALIAPRALVIEAGECDHIFPIAATREAFAQLGPVWEAHDAVPPELVVTPSGHAFRAERSLEALVEQLTG
ncbi:dienelactone hydrolase family protein [Brachybacterium sp. GU-2]|uniref:dienelactone hydrolase family protein n=1 Tax=Brachybacterium sp. GU-2 TaxID=3069708 RepID=UPI00280AD490|nr:dienelactone hydrolase family protein [Brachybacterium sp. GU-2]WME22518.1 dienelactone hydrolase family protein [Brachybacterium sp. GU-2]